MSSADGETTEEKLERLMLEDYLFSVSEIGEGSYYSERRQKEEEIERKHAEWEEHLKNEEEKKKGRGRRRERGQGHLRYRDPSDDDEEESDNLSPAALAERTRKNRELASKFMNENESYKLTNEYLMNQYNRLHKRKAQEKANEEVTKEPVAELEEEREFVPEAVAVAPKEQPRQSKSPSAVKEKSEPVNKLIPRKAKKNRKEKNAMLMALEKKKDQPSVSDVPNSVNKKGESKSQASLSQKKLDDGSESAARLTAILLGKEHDQSGTVIKPVVRETQRLDVTERFSSFYIGGTEDDDDSKGSVCSSSSSYFTASSSGTQSDKDDPVVANFTTPASSSGTLCSGDSADVNTVESKKKKVMHTTSKRVRRLPVQVPLSGAPPAREFRFNPPAGRGRFNIKSSSDFPTL